jgi:phosphoglycerate dehydrogenase-like enzyme
MSGAGPGPGEGAPGPGRGPGGVPRAIALSPILSARYRAEDLARIAAAAPGARIVTVSAEGLADGPLDEVEVLLRGSLAAEVFDRILARAPHLVWVHSATAGVERVLTPASRARGLVITNARGVFSQPIAEYVVAVILAVTRRLPELLELQRERTWQPLVGTELADRTVAIVGYGSIGRHLAALLAPFGCRILAVRRRPELGLGGTEGGEEGEAEEAAPAGAAGVDRAGPVGARGGPTGGPRIAPRVDALVGPDALADVLREADFVVLALPLTAATANLVDEARLALMKRGAWLVNVARAQLVDEVALRRALREGRLGGAVLDTFLDEPLPPTSPWWTTPNVIVTPHTSWSSGRVLDRSIELFCENLRRYASGQPLRNVVDPAAGY